MAGGKALIEWQLERSRARASATWWSTTRTSARRSRRRWATAALGVRIAYSHEPQALETAGGVAQALPLLGAEPFVVVSGDIHTDFDYALARRASTRSRAIPSARAHFVLVDNPPWHPGATWRSPTGASRARAAASPTATSRCSTRCCSPSIAPRHALKLFPWAYRFVDAGRVSGEHFRGAWDNVGTPAQLAALDRRLADDALHPAALPRDDPTRSSRSWSAYAFGTLVTTGPRACT
jgi:MurNAc alpha-1-phosphate uridylyltransferase